jgi:hypothetical protein
MLRGMTSAPNSAPFSKTPATAVPSAMPSTVAPSAPLRTSTDEAHARVRAHLQQTFLDRIQGRKPKPR